MCLNEYIYINYKLKEVKSYSQIYAPIFVIILIHVLIIKQITKVVSKIHIYKVFCRKPIVRFFKNFWIFHKLKSK